MRKEEKLFINDLTNEGMVMTRFLQTPGKGGKGKAASWLSKAGMSVIKDLKIDRKMNVIFTEVLDKQDVVAGLAKNSA
jgi:hypothetical protein